MIDIYRGRESLQNAFTLRLCVNKQFVLASSLRGLLSIEHGAVFSPVIEPRKLQKTLQMRSEFVK